MAFLDIFSKTQEESINIEKPTIIIDTREKQSLVASELVHNGCEIKFKQLKVGDYIVKNTLIERKTVSDFIGSMVSGRLRKQLKNMQKVKNKILLIEGIDEQELYHPESNINENAIRGFLLSIILNYKIPIIFTKNYEDTAKFLVVLAKKQEKERELGINTKPRATSVKEQLQFIIEGFPGIGPKNAKKLLNEFKTIKNIINIPIEDLKKIIGKKAEIFKLLDHKY